MVRFHELLTDNEAELRSEMRWENYTINETVIPVIDLLKTDALNALRRAYGKYYVYPDIYDDVLNDVFTYFPILMQQLAISRLLDAYVVNQNDLEKETTTRTEKRDQVGNENSSLTKGTSTSEISSQNNEQKNTGTVKDSSTQDSESDSTNQIDNTSGIEQTGSRSVQLAHAMPEQSIDGTTGNLPEDEQGTPILKTSYVQSANESFATTNPIQNSESSQQHTTGTGKVTSEATQTNDLTQTDTMTGNRTVTDSGTDQTASTTENTENATITETRELSSANKQYAQEVSGFLEVAGKTVAFENFVNSFSWVVGIQ